MEEKENIEEAAVPEQVPNEEGVSPREDFIAFFAEHPELEPGQIGQEVLRAVAEGESLSLAWTKSENARLRAELEAMKQNERNASRSAPSTFGSGLPKADPIDAMWDEEE